MSIPIDNRFFQKGKTGYKIHGRSDCVSQVPYKGTDFDPLRGGNILVLDDESFDPQNGRPLGNGKPNPCATTQFSIGTSPKTTGVDGAILEIPDVTLSTDSAVWFIWSFLPFENSQDTIFNSFALFAAYEKSTLDDHGDFSHANPIHQKTLGESSMIPNAKRRSLKWYATAWVPKSPFTGTLCWVVSTGVKAATDAQCRPSLLLLDTIDINRRS